MVLAPLVLVTSCAERWGFVDSGTRSPDGDDGAGVALVGSQDCIKKWRGRERHETRVETANAMAGSSSAMVLTDQEKSAQKHERLPWVEKYRPSTLDDVIAHEQIISTINRLIDNERLPHMLLYGPPGTGKTTTILAVARRLYGPKFANFVLNLNASDDRGIDVVRNTIKDFASTRKIFSKGFKLIILDEADAMTNDAQAALRRVMEKYTKNVRFCLICNYVNKIIPAIQSRCTKFRFGPLKKSQIVSRLHVVADSEKVGMDEKAADAVIRLGAGDMRRCLNILQSAAMSSTAAADAATGVTLISEDDVYMATGAPLPSDIHAIVGDLLNCTLADALNNLRQLSATKGLSLVDICTEIHNYVLRIDFANDVKMFLVRHLADIEYRLAIGCAERVQAAALVGAFQIAKETMIHTSEDTEMAG